MSDMEFDSQFINYPHGENIYVNRLYRYQQCLISLYYTDNVLEKQRKNLVNSIEQIIDGMDAPMRIVVAGGFNAGKSTFINALLGAELMPAKVIRTTAIINCLVAGKNKELTIFRYDNTVEVKSYLNAEHLRSQIEEAMANESAAIHHIDIACPNPEHHFLDKFTLIDTPGLDYNEQDSATSLREVERADALIWVLHNVGVTKEDNKNLQRFHTENPDKPIIVIINQIDDLEDNELESVIKKVQNHTEGLVKKVFPLSAKLAFVGRRDNHDLKYQQSGFFNLNSYLHSNLFNTYGELQESKIRIQCELIAKKFDNIKNQELLINNLKEAEQAKNHTQIHTFFNKKTEDILNNRIQKIKGLL